MYAISKLGTVAAVAALSVQNFFGRFGDLKPKEIAPVIEVGGTYKFRDKAQKGAPKHRGRHRRRYLSGKPLFR